MGDWFYIFETFNLNFYFLAPRLARTLGSWMECGIDCRLGRLSSWNTRCSAVWLAGYDVWCRHVWWWRWPGPGNDGGGGSVTAGPGVTMEMWTLPQPGLYLHCIIWSRIHISPWIPIQGSPLEPFTAPQWSCKYWLVTQITGQHVRRPRGHLVSGQVTNPPPSSRFNTTQTFYHLFGIGTPPSQIWNL